MIVTVLLMACSSKSSDESPPANRGTPEGPPALDAGGLSLAERLPAAGDVDGFLANYDSQINGRLERLDEEPGDALAARAAVDLLLTRAQFLGTLGDYERADRIAGALVRAQPNDPSAYLVRADVNARLHRFDEAMADVVAAEKLGMSPTDGNAVRAQVTQGRGDYEDALRRREASAEKRPNGLTLGALAALYAERGEFDKAHATFDKAVDALKPGSPIGPAWLLFQWGRAYELEGASASARDMYSLTHQRFPRYAEATSHYAAALAATGDRPRAIELLRELTKRIDHPEYVGQLAELLAEAETPDPSLVEAARTGWEHWLTAFPEAFADHAARFYLGIGANPARALELAQLNAANRRTPATLTLLIQTALAAENPKAACEAAGAALALTNPTRQLLFESWRAFKACNNTEMTLKLSDELGIPADTD